MSAPRFAALRALLAEHPLDAILCSLAEAAESAAHLDFDPTAPAAKIRRLAQDLPRIGPFPLPAVKSVQRRVSAEHGAYKVLRVDVAGQHDPGAVFVRLDSGEEAWWSFAAVAADPLEVPATPTSTVRNGQRRVHPDLGAYCVEDVDDGSCWVVLDRPHHGNPRRLWSVEVVARDPLEQPTAPPIAEHALAQAKAEDDATPGGAEIRALVDAAKPADRQAARGLETLAEVEASRDQLAAKLDKEHREIAEVEADRDRLAIDADRRLLMIGSAVDALREAGIDTRATEGLSAAIGQLAAERDGYKVDLRAELDGNAALRKEHGAKDGETFRAFVGRLAKDRVASLAERLVSAEERAEKAEWERDLARDHVDSIYKAFAAPGVPEAPLPEPEQVIAGLRALVKADDKETVEQAVHRAFEVVRSKLHGAIGDIADMKRHVETLTTESGGLLSAIAQAATDARIFVHGGSSVQTAKELLAKIMASRASWIEHAEMHKEQAITNGREWQTTQTALDTARTELRRRDLLVEAVAPKRRAIIDLLVERERQDQKWGGPQHDDAHAPIEWLGYIFDHAARAGMGRAVEQAEGKDEHFTLIATPHAFALGAYRRQMVRVAALAVAAVEAWDRQHPERPRGGKAIGLDVENSTTDAEGRHDVPVKLFDVEHGWAPPENGGAAAGTQNRARGAEEKAFRHLLAAVGHFIERLDRTGLVTRIPFGETRADLVTLLQPMRASLNAAGVATVRPASISACAGVIVPGESLARNAVRRVLSFGPVHIADIEAVVHETGEINPLMVTRAALDAIGAVHGADGFWRMPNPKADDGTVVLPRHLLLRVLFTAWQKLGTATRDELRTHGLSAPEAPTVAWEGDTPKQRLLKAWMQLAPKQQQAVLAYTAILADPALTPPGGDVALALPTLIPPSPEAERLAKAWAKLSEGQRLAMTQQAEHLAIGRSVALLIPSDDAARKLAAAWGISTPSRRAWILRCAESTEEAFEHLAQLNLADALALALGAKLRFKGTASRADFSVVAEPDSAATVLLNLVSHLRARAKDLR